MSNPGNPKRFLLCGRPPAPVLLAATARILFADPIAFRAPANLKGKIGGMAGNTTRIPMYACAIADAEIEAAVDVLRSGNLAQGERVRDFEEAWSAKFGVRHAVTCSSGTAALRLALQAVVRPGDEVLIPGLTFIATASAVVEAGAIPVACDVDPETWLIDLEDAAARLSARTRVILPVHLFGNPCDPAATAEFAKTHGLDIIWDAAQAHGAAVQGSDVAGWPLMTCYSFYATKNLYLGEGGMVCTGDDALADRLARMRNHGMDHRGLWVERGSNYRMMELQGAIGAAQLKRFDAMAARRRSNARYLQNALADIPGLHCQAITPGATHAWHQFAVRIEPRNFGTGRDGLAAALSRSGIETAVYYRTGINAQPYYDENFASGELPVTNRLSVELLSLPVHDELSQEHMAQIADAVRNTCDQTTA